GRRDAPPGGRRRPHPMTDRKKSASGIQPLPASLREWVDACPDVLFTCDAEGRWVWLSAAIEPLTGFRSRDLLGHASIALVAPRERRRLLRALLPVLRPHANGDEAPG